MITVEATPFFYLLWALFSGGVGVFFLYLGGPSYLEDRNGGLLFLVIVGAVFVLLSIIFAWLVVLARRDGYGWFDPIQKKAR